MSEDSELYEAMDRARKERHAEWKVVNMQAIKDSGIFYRVASPETILFRNPGKPKADFYPSTGRWRTPQSGKTYNGGAKAFISWYQSNSTLLT